MLEPGAGPPLWALLERTHLLVLVRGRIAPADVPAGCARIRTLLAASDAGLVVCDLATLSDPDLSTVDALARLVLDARRLGREVRVREAPPRLRLLLAFVGLASVVPCA